MLCSIIKKYYYKWHLGADEQLVMLLPPTTLVLPQSAPAFLMLVTLVLLATRSSDCPAIFPAMGQLLRAPLALAIGLFLFWAALSGLWSPVPGASAAGLAKLLAMVAAAIFLLGVVATEPLSGGRAMRLKTAVAMLAAGGTVLFGLTYAEIGDALGIPITDRQFRRIAVILTLLLPFMIGHRPYSTALRGSLGLVLVAVIFFTPSEAAKLGVIVAVSSFVLAAIAWRVALVAAGFALILITLFMPLLVPLLQSPFATRLISLLGEAHVAERLEIWRQSVLLIPFKPLRGWGFESSRAVFENLPPEVIERLGVALDP
ncbi:MAG TPA: hypothetical protein VK844_04780, partial [Hyphomicrobiales bacterium]|nr:hypothetical protein [Hyphomicrobiales bacterium]